MATHHGNEGTVKVGANAVAEVTEWQFDESAQIDDDTAMGDVWDSHVLRRKSWSGRVSCHWDETDATGQGALTIGASVTLNLYPEGATTGDVYHTGTATVTAIAHQSSKDGVTGVTFSFTGNGAATHPTVA